MRIRDSQSITRYSAFRVILGVGWTPICFGIRESLRGELCARYRAVPVPLSGSDAVAPAHALWELHSEHEHL